MANKSKKRKPGRKLPPLSRADLLPLTATQFRDISLRSHLALVAVRSGHGNLTLVGELLRTVYVTYYVYEAQGQIPYIEDFVEAEICLKASMDRGELEDVWAIDETGGTAMVTVLRLQDEQLATQASFRIERARGQLRAVLDRGIFPDLARDHAGSSPPLVAPAHAGCTEIDQALFA